MRLRGTHLALVVAAACVALALGAAANAVGREGGRETVVPNLERVVDAREAPRAHAEQTVEGVTWSVTTVRTKDGKLCAGEKVPGEGQAISCWDEGEMFAEQSMFVQHGARQLPGQSPTKWNAMWVWGLAAPSVAEVEIITTACRVIRLVPDADGVFMHVFGQSEQSEGWPYRVQALTATDGLLATRLLAFRPPATEAAKAAGLAAPQPAAACR